MAPGRGRVLMLGAGFVAKPALQVLHEHGFFVTVACVDLDAAQRLCNGLENTRPVYLDVTNEHELDQAIVEVELVISLIPFTFHVAVVQSAIRNRKNVVTTSYISPAMSELHDAVRNAGILVLNECGLDPGIDHLLAIQTIDEVHRDGGLIRSLRSYCGALPAPDSADNPLGYKLSWSPRGVLLALKNPASFYVDGVVQEVSGASLMDHARPFCQIGRYGLVAYPNRDSTAYRSRYQIPEARTVMRNTLRYSKFPAIIKALTDTGFLDDKIVPYLDPASKTLEWNELTKLITHASSSNDTDLTKAIASITSFKSAQEKSQVFDGLRWLGLFSKEPVIPHKTLLDTLCGKLEEKLSYGPEERDMVMFQHHFEIEHKNGDLETRIVSMTEFGDPGGHSALARLVGTPCAVAAIKILDGSISGTGVLAPMEWKVVGPMLEELEAYGIRPKVERSFQQNSSSGPVVVEDKAIKVA